MNLMKTNVIQELTAEVWRYDQDSNHLQFQRKVTTLKMGLLSDSLTILATQFLFFLIGWIFFVKKLFKDYELRHHMVQIIFCVNFTLSCTMFELIIFEISDTLERSSRYFHWYLSLYMTLFMVIIMTPLYLRYVIRFYIIFKNIASIVD